MNLNLAGKIALITGSSSGIGFAIAQALSEEGATVVLNGRNMGNLSIAAKKIPSANMSLGDVSDPETCKNIIEDVLLKHGRIDILICNVGNGKSVAPGQETVGEWRRMIDINLYSATQLVEAAQNSLALVGGNIICVSSICGIEALGAPVAYASAKAALQSFVKNMARPLGKRGIRINSVAPGNIFFPGSVWEKKLSEDRLAVESMLASEVALNCFGKPSDVASLVAYLASPVASFITGATYVIDGGQTRS